jgi:hypothetical protein
MQGHFPSKPPEMSRSSSYYRRRQSRPNYDQNDGKPGVVYILKNDAFKEEWIKIGQSTQSGHVRARRINEQAGTGIPKHHRCVFEHPTDDCGRAEKAIHLRLAPYRKGNQEYFECDFELAKRTVTEECRKIDLVVRQQVNDELVEREKASAQKEA